MDKATRRRLDIASRLSLFTYANSAVILPVSLLAITRELGFSYTQAGSLSFIAAIVEFAVLLGSIPLAAAAGKIRPLRTGLWILGTGLVLFTGIRSFPSAVLVIVVVGLGQAMQEALLTPLVEDIHPEDDGSRQVFLHAFWPIGVIFGTLVFGESLSRGADWRDLFLVLGIFCVFVGLIYPKPSRANLPRSRTDFSHAGEILARPLFWVMGSALFFAGGAEGGFTFWTASYIQIEYAARARAGGLGTALFAVGMALGRLLVSRIAPRFGLRKILLLSTAAALLGGLAFFFVHRLPSLYLLIVLMGLFIAPFWPGIQTHAVRRLGADPTMVMVFLSCFGLIGYSLANFIMGVIGDRAGLRTSFIVAPLMTSLLLGSLLAEKRFRGVPGGPGPRTPGQVRPIAPRRRGRDSRPSGP